MRYIFILAMILLFLPAGCGEDTDAGNAGGPGPVGEITVTSADTDVTLALTPPEGWFPSDNQAALAYFTCSGESPAYFMVTENFLPAAAKEPDLYVEFRKERYYDRYDIVEFEDAETLTIEGHDGRKLAFTHQFMGRPMKNLIVYVFKGDYAYKLSFNVPAPRFEALESDFEQFIESFEFK